MLLATAESPNLGRHNRPNLCMDFGEASPIETDFYSSKDGLKAQNGQKM
jgi:hypothetical protein